MRLKYANVISKNNLYIKKKNYKYEVYIDKKF